MAIQQKASTDVETIPTSPYTAAYLIIDSCTRTDDLLDFMAPMMVQPNTHVSELVRRYTEKQIEDIKAPANGCKITGVVKGRTADFRHHFSQDMRGEKHSKGLDSGLRRKARKARHWFSVGMDFLIYV